MPTRARQPPRRWHNFASPKKSHDIITRGKALYWGTSEWTADEIRAACEIAERHHLHKPIVEQPQYNLFCRRRVEQEYRRLYDDLGLGLTIWSPLASGLLTGKYRNGIPGNSRGALDNYAFLRERLTDPGRNNLVGRLADVAKDLNASLAQLGLAWCLKNPHVSSVITGASRAAQVQENMKAAELAPRLTVEVLARIEAIIAGSFE